MAIKTEFVITAQDETGKAIDSAKGGISDLGDHAREFANVAGAAFAAAGAAAAVFAAAAINNSLNTAREIDNLSRIAGTSVESFQKMAFGAKAFGVEQDKLSDILKDTNEKIGDFIATGGGEAKDFFENIAPKVGVTADQFRGLSGPDALQLYVSSLQKANLSQQEMTFYMESIANDATLLLPLLKDNGKAFLEQAKAAEALGIVLSRTDVSKMKEAQGAILQTKEAFGGFTDQLAAKFAPIITALSTEILEAIKQTGGFGQIANEVFEGVIKAAAYTANVIHGLGVVWDGLKIIVVSGMETALRYFELVETGIRTVLNMVPGVAVSTDSAIGNIRQSFSNTREQFITDFQNTLNQPMPYEGIVKWAEEATKAATERAAQVALATTGTASVQAASLANGGGEGDLSSISLLQNDQSIDTKSWNPVDDPEVIKAQERMAYLRTLKDVQVASDIESEELAFLNRMEMLRVRFEENEIPTIEAYNRLKESVQKKHESTLSAITNKGAAARAAFDKKTTMDQSKQVFGELANITSGVAQHNKGLFELNKAAAIANAIINTYEGVSMSLGSYPMPLAAIMAAAHLAAGLATVMSIKKQSFGSTNAGATSVGAAPVTTAPSNTGNAAPTNQQVPVEKKPDVYINIEPNANYSGSAMRDMMERLAEEQGYNVRFG